MKNYIDIHCHSVMTHYRNQELNIPACEEIHRESIIPDESLRSSYTQSDFGKLVTGNVGAIMISLYPIERKWLFPDRERLSNSLELAVSNITGYSRKNVNQMYEEIKAGTIPYYDDLVGEYKYLLTQVNKDCNGKEVKIVTNYNEYLENKKTGDKISVILSIEGAHSLGTIEPADLTMPPDEVTKAVYEEKYRKNLFDLKNWGPNGTHTPFYITLSHHFWNMIAGHTESIPDIFDQKTGKDSGFTEGGRVLLDDLLSSNDQNGIPNKTRRVLIDMKHMSPLTRQEFYKIIKEKRRTDGINIPILCSHASIGDAENLELFINDPKYKKPRGERNYFNTSSLSLTNEDINTIIDSDGIIGIILHEARIAHKKAINKGPYFIDDYRKKIKNRDFEIEKLQARIQGNLMISVKEKLLEEIKELQQQKNDFGEKIKEGFALMVLANIYKIVEVYSEYNPAQPAKGWDHIGIGSDFDGMVNKLDYLGTSKEFPDLEKLLIKFLTNPEPLDKFNPDWSAENLKALQFNQPAGELAAKIMSKNADEFLRKYFTEDYLKKGINPAKEGDEHLIA